MSRIVKNFLFVGCFLILMTSVYAGVFAQSKWEREVSLGYTKRNGNTRNAQLVMDGVARRILEDEEFSIKMNIYYSSTNGTMDGQSWAGTMKQLFYLDDQKGVTHLYQMEVTHDRFADVDYRIIPSTGLGYWFVKTDDTKTFLEGSFGYELTNYRSNLPDDEEAVLIIHGLYDKRIFEDARISEDISLYPSLSQGGDFRVSSNTSLINPLSETLDIKVSFILDYDSALARGFKKTDTKFITGLKYLF